MALYLALEKPAIAVLMVPVKRTTRRAEDGESTDGNLIVARSDSLSYVTPSDLADGCPVHDASASLYQEQ